MCEATMARADAKSCLCKSNRHRDERVRLAAGPVFEGGQYSRRHYPLGKTVSGDWIGIQCSNFYFIDIKIDCRIRYPAESHLY